MKEIWEKRKSREILVNKFYSSQGILSILFSFVIFLIIFHLKDKIIIQVWKSTEQ